MVKLLSVQCHSFGKTEGSKGGAGVALGIGNTTLAAISCHLASKKPLIRLAQFKELCKVLGAKLGNEFFQLTESFHHVIWLGDLNYRCSDVTPSGVCPCALSCVSLDGVLPCVLHRVCLCVCSGWRGGGVVGFRVEKGCAWASAVLGWRLRISLP
jgi:hypothetical protein